MQQPKKPRWKRWLIAAALTLGMGGAITGGMNLNGSLPTFGPPADQGSTNETISINHPDIVWVTIDKSASITGQFNTVAPGDISSQNPLTLDKEKQTALNQSLQIAARGGDFAYVKYLVEQGADVKANDGAAVQAAKDGAGLAQQTGGDQQAFNQIIKFLQDKGGKVIPPAPGN